MAGRVTHEALAEPIGPDGRPRLWTLGDPATPAWRRAIPAVQTLRHVWLQPCYASPADHLLTRRTEPGIALLGPVTDDQRWQAHPGNGCAAAPLLIDGDATHAIGPPGQWSVVGMERPDRHGQATVPMKCRRPVCAGGARRGDGPCVATVPRT
jgi:hypothetical protein